MFGPSYFMLKDGLNPVSVQVRYAEGTSAPCPYKYRVIENLDPPLQKQVWKIRA